MELEGFSFKRLKSGVKHLSLSLCECESKLTSSEHFSAIHFHRASDKSQSHTDWEAAVHQEALGSSQQNWGCGGIRSKPTAITAACLYCVYRFSLNSNYVNRGETIIIFFFKFHVKKHYL